MNGTSLDVSAALGEPGPALSPFEEERRRAEAMLGISHEEALQRVTERFEKSKRDRRSRELTWWLCLAFYLDDHYASISKKEEAVIPGSKQKGVPKYRVRAQLNKITPAADELVGRMVRSMPTLTANPATENPADLDGALIGSAALMHEWRRLDLTLNDHEVRTWAAITGTGGIWTRWNQSVGAPLAGGQGPRGENECLVLSPFDLFPDPNGSRYHNMRYFALAFEENVEDLQAAYPDLKDEIVGSQGKQESRYYEDQLKALMSASLGAPGITGYESDTSTLIHHWEPRSPRFPNGLMVIALPTVVLWMGPNPWAHFGGGADKWCPVDIFRYRVLSNSFWGKGAVESAIPIQKQLNRTISQILEIRNEASNPMWFFFRGMKVNLSQWTRAPGAHVWVTPPPPEWSAGGKIYKPERVDPSPIPGALFRLIADLKAEIEDIFAYHQVSKGTPPMKLSGKAIEDLQEADNAGSIPIVQRHNLVWSTIGRRLLTLVRDQWTDERVIEVRGDEGFTELRSFRGADIPEFLNVTVDTDVMLPITRQGKLQALFGMVQLQILSPMEAREAIFGGFGTVRAATFRASVDQRKQRRENAKMAAGIPVPVDFFDADEIHLKELNDWRKSASYERVKDTPVPLVGPDGRPIEVTIAELVEMHAQGHGANLIRKTPRNVVGPEEATGPGAEGRQEETAEPGAQSPANASGPAAVGVSGPDFKRGEA